MRNANLVMGAAMGTAGSVAPTCVREVLRRIRLETHRRARNTHFSTEQVAQLCDLDQSTCALVLGALVDSGFLSHADGTFAVSAYGPEREWEPRAASTPLLGDVLITRQGETRFVLSSFPQPPTTAYASLDMALGRADLRAATERVDVWYTVDRCTFVLKHGYRDRTPVSTIAS